MAKKRLVKFLSIVSSILIIGSVFTGCGKTESAQVTDGSKVQAFDQNKKPEDYKATLTVWGWDENYFKTMTAEFNKTYPNIKFEYTPVSNGDYLQKLQTALASGGDVPDILWSIIDSRGRAFELDTWEALDKAPYNFDKSQVFDYIQPYMVNSKGDVVGIEQCINPAGLAFRRELAKQYLGTDDPAELSKKVSNWDQFIEVGKQVKEKSGGKVFMLPGMTDALQILDSQNPTPVVENGTINITKVYKTELEYLVKFRDAGIVNKLESWSPAWYASYGEPINMFAGCATWTPQFVIQPNDKDGKGKAHWGLMNAPGGNFSWGGTAMGISKSSKNKEAAWQFIKFATASQEGAKAAKSIGFLTSYKEPYKDAEFASDKNEWFGGEDIGKFFMNDVAPNIKVRPMSQYDNVIHDALVLVSTSINNDPKITAQDALKKFIDEVHNKIPDAEVK